MGNETVNKQQDITESSIYEIIKEKLLKKNIGSETEREIKAWVIKLQQNIGRAINDYIEEGREKDTQEIVIGENGKDVIK